MTRDHLLFLLIGLLGGFVFGYLMHEVMATRQPLPAWTIARAQALDPIAPGGGPLTAPVLPSPGPPPPGVQQPAAEVPAATEGAMAAMQEVQRLRAYVEENPQDAEALRTLANLNYDIQNWGGARDLYERYLALVPGDLDVTTDLGATYRYLEQPERALELFRAVRASSPTHWQSRYNEVLVLAFDLGRPRDAQPALDELKALQPENVEVGRLAQAVEERF
ncbi:MAG: tetratricopeptide repeat protein [Acidobacteriota bacterium]